MTTETTCPTRYGEWPTSRRDREAVRPDSSGAQRVLDEAALRRLVQLHRDRADELASPLSMIVMANNDARRDNGTRPEWGVALRGHLKEIDGPWFGGPRGRDRYVIFLVDTARSLADRLAHWLVARLEKDGMSVTSSVHTYFALSKAKPIGTTAGGGYPFGDLCFRETPRWKRLIDIAGSGTAIVALLPLFVLIAGFIKSVSHGPVWFTQARIGAKGRPFRIIKFRTMRVSNNAEAHKEHVGRLATAEDAPLKKMDDRCELIPFAWLLRAMCIDELPQLFNVLRGEMSLVGPRPDVLPMEAYRHGHLQRFDVLPGMTGLWQVSGKNRTTFSEMIELDIRYVKTRSFWLDMKIMALTFPAIVAQVCFGR